MEGNFRVNFWFCRLVQKRGPCFHYSIQIYTIFGRYQNKLPLFFNKLAVVAVSPSADCSIPPFEASDAQHGTTTANSKKEQAREWIYLSLAMVKCVKIWLFSEYEVHRQNQARKAREVVPFEGVALDEKHRKEREDDQ